MGQREKNTAKCSGPPSVPWPEVWLDHFLFCLSSLGLVAASAVAGSRLSHHLVVLALPSSGNSPWTGFPVLNTVILGFPSWPWMTDFTLCTFKPQPHCLCWWLVPVTELGWDFLTDSVWLFPVLGHCKRMQPGACRQPWLTAGTTRSSGGI